MLDSTYDRAREVRHARAWTFVWNHLVTSDQEKCGQFYCELLGWSRREVDAGPMGVCTVFQRSIGGQILVPPHDIPGVGRACLIADPTGAALTLMTPANGL